MPLSLRLPLQLAVFGTAYFLGAMAYVALYWRTGDLPPVWPPAGLYLAALLLVRPVRWPWWIAAAAPAGLAAFLIGGYGLSTAIGMFAADTVAAATGAWLAQQACGRPFRLAGLRDFAVLIGAGAILAPMPSALIGALVLAIGEGLPFQVTVVNWWSGDFTAVVLVSPLILLWVSGEKVWPRHWRPAAMGAARTAELLALILATLAVPAAILTWLDWSFSFLAMPVLLWAAIRFGPLEAALCNLLLAAVAITQTMSGLGVGSADSGAVAERLHYLQAFLSFMAIGASLTVALALRDWREADRARALGEARWTAMLDHAPVAIAVLDTDGRVISTNRRYVEWYRPDGGEVTGTRAADYFPAEVAERIARNLRRVVHDRQPFASEHDLPQTEGGPRRIEVLRFPMTDDAGRVVAIGVFVTDVTATRRAQEQLVQAQKMEAVGQLTGGVAHDFNNLLAVIIGNLELVQEQLPPDSAMARHVVAAFRAAERGEALTRSLLAFSRRQALRPQLVDLNEVVRGMLPLLSRTLGSQVQIEMVTAAGLWRSEVDPAQVESALLNLAINARDAMPGGGRLTIETANVRLDQGYAGSLAEAVAPGQYAMIAVSDTGEGMPEEVRARVFEPFFTTKEAGRGTGLGMSMVQGFVRQSGGHVAIYSEPGHGTTVKVYLPRSHRQEPAPGRVAEDPATSVDDGSSTARRHVLVVEDDPDVRQLAIEILEAEGHRVIAAGDGAAALALAAVEARIDLLLSDVILEGGMSGPDVAAALQAERPDLKVLYMSGYTANGVVHHGRLDPGVELLEKPFRRDQLRRFVRDALAGDAAAGQDSAAPG
ncbi:MASE1 domain-containing protein [Marinibaculum pumilum]|uniref:histidine kinase n=1 Tax=Marinibaculum pumilum TaxID=1766165 RepID=A0ABV7L381_9PROT